MKRINSGKITVSARTAMSTAQNGIKAPRASEMEIPAIEQQM
jgi:hypothetical protein